MTDLEIIKKNFNIITDSESAGYDYWYELEKEALDSATRMAAEIERLKAEIIEANKKAKDQGRTACNLFDELKKLQKENRELEAALAEKPDIVRCGECFDFNSCKCPLATCCNSVYQSPDKNFYCPYGTRKEAKR